MGLWSQRHGARAGRQEEPADLDQGREDCARVLAIKHGWPEKKADIIAKWRQQEEETFNLQTEEEVGKARAAASEEAVGGISDAARKKFNGEIAAARTARDQRLKQHGMNACFDSYFKKSNAVMDAFEAESRRIGALSGAAADKAEAEVRARRRYQLLTPDDEIITKVEATRAPVVAECVLQGRQQRPR
jgi:hypothetical protein